MAKILSQCILEFFEKAIIQRLISYNYFYYTANEKNIIKKNATDLLLIEKQYFTRETIIEEEIFDYIKSNKVVILDGIVNFRLPQYTKLLDSIINFAINKYIIEKEYLEFINLLKKYINSATPKIDLIHLVYINNEFILLDKSNNIISIPDDLSTKAMLKDISFSNNDFVLNTLLTFLPQKIYIHLTQENTDSNEFINTLCEIFTNKVSICKNCDLCKTYSLIQSYDIF